MTYVKVQCRVMADHRSLASEQHIDQPRTNIFNWSRL
jgi:hypothetical protein